MTVSCDNNLDSYRTRIEYEHEYEYEYDQGGQVSQVFGSDEQPRPVSQTCFVQTTLKQLATPAAHFTSHAHDWPHEMPEHELAPEHVTAHGPAPHETLRHEKLPVHSTAQPVDCRQLMPMRHDDGVLHLIWQLKPAGHTI